MRSLIALFVLSNCQHVLIFFNTSALIVYIYASINAAILQHAICFFLPLAKIKRIVDTEQNHVSIVFYILSEGFRVNIRYRYSFIIGTAFCEQVYSCCRKIPSFVSIIYRYRVPSFIGIENIARQGVPRYNIIVGRHHPTAKTYSSI